MQFHKHLFLLHFAVFPFSSHFHNSSSLGLILSERFILFSILLVSPTLLSSKLYEFLLLFLFSLPSQFVTRTEYFLAIEWEEHGLLLPLQIYALCARTPRTCTSKQIIRNKGRSQLELYYLSPLAEIGTSMTLKYVRSSYQPFLSPSYTKTHFSTIRK